MKNRFAVTRAVLGLLHAYAKLIYDCFVPEHEKNLKS